MVRPMRNLILSALLALSATAAAVPINPHQSELIMADDVTGQTITDTQIQAVLDYETTLLNDPDPDVASLAASEVVVCQKALAGNEKDRSKVAFLYNTLVAAGTIQPVA